MLLSEVLNDAAGRVVEQARSAPGVHCEKTTEGTVLAYMMIDEINITINVQDAKGNHRNFMRASIPVEQPEPHQAEAA